MFQPLRRQVLSRTHSQRSRAISDRRVSLVKATCDAELDLEAKKAVTVMMYSFSAVYTLHTSYEIVADMGSRQESS